LGSRCRYTCSGNGMENNPALEADFAAIADFERLVAQSQFYRLFPEEDMVQPDGSVIHARHKYARHLEFFEAGAKYRERCFLAANRVGKTLGAGGFETAAHLTGEYPHWWKGRRFTKPVKWWAVGKSCRSPPATPVTKMLHCTKNRSLATHRLVVLEWNLARGLARRSITRSYRSGQRRCARWFAVVRTGQGKGKEARPCRPRTTTPEHRTCRI